jgi:hypothetical protein
MVEERRWKNYVNCDMKNLSTASTTEPSLKFHGRFTLKHGQAFLKQLPMLRTKIFRLKLFGHERMSMYMAL